MKIMCDKSKGLSTSFFLPQAWIVPALKSKLELKSDFPETKKEVNILMDQAVIYGYG